MKVGICFFLTFIVLVLLPPQFAFANQSLKLNAKQQQIVQKLISKFRRYRKDHQKRTNITEELLEFGHPAAIQLFGSIGKELHPQLNRYRGQFFRAARVIASGKIKNINLVEVQQLRQKMLALGALGNGLTRQMIQSTGDPALKRLSELMVIDRSKVLDGNESLKMKRGKLLMLGELWEKCIVELAKNRPKSKGQEQKTPLSFEAYLQGEEELAAQLAMPMDNSTRAILSFNSRLESKIDPEEARCILAVNLTRNLLGLNALQIDLGLCAAARDHSNDMKRMNFFAHTSPIAGKTSPWDRAKRFRTSASSENIAMGTRDGRQANLMWFHSPGHHINMLNISHKRVGVGRGDVYWTELFGK